MVPSLSSPTFFLVFFYKILKTSTVIAVTVQADSNDFFALLCTGKAKLACIIFHYGEKINQLKDGEKRGCCKESEIERGFKDLSIVRKWSSHEKM